MSCPSSQHLQHLNAQLEGRVGRQLIDALGVAQLVLVNQDGALDAGRTECTARVYGFSGKAGVTWVDC